MGGRMLASTTAPVVVFVLSPGAAVRSLRSFRSQRRDPRLEFPLPWLVRRCSRRLCRVCAGDWGPPLGRA
jgi:hypothetical protein